MKTRTKNNVVLSFKRPQFNLREIVQYQAHCNGPGIEVSIGYTNNEAEREISVGYLAPNRKYICKVSSSLGILSHVFVYYYNYYSNKSGYSALLERHEPRF